MERPGMNEGEHEISDGLEEDRRRPERGKEEARKVQGESLHMAASKDENECERTGKGEEGKVKVVARGEETVKEEGERRRAEPNDEEEGKEDEPEKAEVEGEGEGVEGRKGEGEEEESEEEEGHLSVPSPRPPTRCHYQSASFLRTWIFPALKIA